MQDRHSAIRIAHCHPPPLAPGSRAEERKAGRVSLPLSVPPPHSWECVQEKLQQQRAGQEWGRRGWEQRMRTVPECCIQPSRGITQGLCKRSSSSRRRVEANPIPPLYSRGSTPPPASIWAFKEDLLYSCSGLPLPLPLPLALPPSLPLWWWWWWGRLLLLPQFLNHLHGQHLLNAAKRLLGQHPPFSPPPSAHHFPKKGCLEGGENRGGGNRREVDGQAEEAPPARKNAPPGHKDTLACSLLRSAHTTHHAYFIVLYHQAGATDICIRPRLIAAAKPRGNGER